ncbi:MAG: hypothetical protein LHV69_12100, partial [Elusimicrobia bacterium]|nr:hypothetical protein [Candidatus Obscuribacterium magneticum]
MTDEVSSTALPTKEDWQRLLRRFKEQLAQRLWALPTVSEAEKELVYKEYLSDLDEFERSVSDAHDEMVSLEKRAHEENDLLRSLLGIPEEELRARSVALNHDLNTTREDMERVRSELDEATRRGA